MKYIYGPIKSRRLGLSLGLSLSADKKCNLNCVYCQWGRTPVTVSERKEHVSSSDIIAELNAWFKAHPQKAKELNFVTISGLGEPTLNTCIGDLISRLRVATGAKIALITNSTLLGDPQVRKSILGVDLIVPSLDSVDPGIFRLIDRPHAGIELEKIIEGLVSLRKEFRGEIWLEVMLVSGINDDAGHIKALGSVIQRINPDRIQLNSPVRSTAEKNILPVGKARLQEIRRFLGEKAEIV